MTATDHARVPTPRTFSSPRDALREMAGLARSTVPLVRAYQGGLDPALRERVMVAVSRANACRECTRVHERWALHHGVSDEELESIGLADMAALDDESRAAVVFAAERADRRFRSPSSSDVERAARERLSPARREQVDAVARAMAFANLTLNTCKAAVAAGPSARGDHPVFAPLRPASAPGEGGWITSFEVGKSAGGSFSR